MAFWSELLKVGAKYGGKLVGASKAAAPHVMSAAKTGFHAAKVAYPEIKSAVKTGAHVTKSTVEFAAKHKVTTATATAIILPKVGHKEGLLNFAKNHLLGEEEGKNGLVQTAGTLLLGEQKDAQGNDKSTAGKITDTLLGEGTYANMYDGVGNIANEGANLYHRLGNGLAGVGNEVGNLYQGAKENIGGMFTGNGMVANGDGTYSDPTTAQYPNMAQMGIQQGGGVMSGLMGGLNNAVNTVSGGNVSKMNLAGLLISAYMMFGRFGWLGKAASLMLGGMTLKNINNHQQQGSQMRQGTGQQQGTGQSNASAAYQQQLKTLEQQASNDDDVVVRSRSL